MRKQLLYGVIFWLAQSPGFAQDANRSVITYIAEVPLIIESGLFVDTLDKQHVLSMLSGKIRIALAPRITAIPSDLYLKVSRPRPVQEYSDISYRWFFDGGQKDNWRRVPPGIRPVSRFPFSDALVDTSIKAGSKLTLQFRSRISGKLLQQTFFYRPELLPSISRYRQIDVYDSLDTKVKSRAVKNSRIYWKGFDTLHISSINIGPGKHLELLFKKISLNSDSCIFYRCYLQGGKRKPGWKLTGHLLTLTDLRAKKEYILEVRYSGTDAYHSYRIFTLPFWYQTSAAKAWYITLCMLLLLGLPYSYFRVRLKSEKRNRFRLQEQMRAVQSQLNPHFVYNALSSIEGLVTNRENDRANEYLAEFSDIMRETMRTSNILFTSLSQELDMLEKYLRIEQLRFEFTYIISIDSDLDLEAIEFPPMLLQPTVENAVKHGLAGMGKDGSLSLSFLKRETDLEIIITDNGIFKEQSLHKGQGYGMKFTSERMENLQQWYRNGKISYHPVYGSDGMTVNFLFENWIHLYALDYHR